MNRAPLLLSLALMIGCHSAAHTTSSQTATSGAGGAAGTTATATTAGPTTGAFSTGAGAMGCANHQAQLAWVVSDVQDSYYNLVNTFDPATQDFVAVHTLNCVSAGHLHAMAISRDRVGWYAYADANQDALYTSDLSNAGDCAPFMNIPSAFGLASMAFVADAPGATTETLYVAGANGALAKVDMSQKTLVPVTSWSGDPAVGSLPAIIAGHSDGSISALFTTSPDVRLAQTDKTGHIASDVAMTGMPPDHVVAFTQFGGKDYVFTTPIPGMCGDPPVNCSDSAAAEYDPVTKTLDPMYIPDVGFTIVAAAVTTCPSQ